MQQITQNYKTGALNLEEVPQPALKSTGVLVRTHCSLISAGTERMKIDLANKSYLGKAKAKPEQVKQVVDTLKKEGFLNTYRKVMGKLDSLTPLGYSCAGEVIAVGEQVSEFRVGDLVACAGAGYANHAEINYIPANLCCKIPAGVSAEAAAFTTLGAIALQGVRQAEIRLGESVAVIGLGLLGQLTVQLLKASGCCVLGLDLNPALTELALKNGADLVGTSGQEDISSLASSISDGYGVDAVIITAATPSNEPVRLAGKILRKKGKVIIVGAVGLNIPRDPDYYQKELDLRLSCSYGPGRYDTVYEEKGIDYPIGYVRWTEKRNMQAFLELLARHKIDLTSIITHRFQLSDALKAYNLIQGKTNEKYLGIVLEYPSQQQFVSRILLEKSVSTNRKNNDIGVSFIGAGSFAKSTLLPPLKAHSNVRFRGISTATGLSARDIGKKYNFNYCTSEVEDIFRDQETNCIFIATRHNLHAPMVVQSLLHQKHVFVEKPLALNPVELEQIQKTYQQIQQQTDKIPSVMVGFNRRFAPLARQVHDFFEKRTNPLAINIRVNAGFIPKTHWTQAPEEGGGRIIGEVCHFIDLMQYFTNSLPVRVYAESTTDNRTDTTDFDQVSMTLKYQDGSIGMIHYFSNGDKSYPKEYIEVFGENRIAIIDDFKSGIFVKNGKTSRVKGVQDKGHQAEVAAWLNSIKNGTAAPIGFDSLVSTTLTSFKVIDSLKDCKVVNI